MLILDPSLDCRILPDRRDLEGEPMVVTHGVTAIDGYDGKAIKGSSIGGCPIESQAGLASADVFLVWPFFTSYG